MKTIYKYPLPNVGNNIVRLPKGAKVLSAGQHYIVGHRMMTRAQIVIWVLLDTQELEENREFHVHATGEPLPTEITAEKFIGTVEFPDDTKWHVFEINRNEDL